MSSSEAGMEGGRDEGMQVEEAGVKPEAPPAATAYKKGAWSKAEDEKLRKAVEEYGTHNWTSVERYSGLARQAKNCRLRWLNYLRPNLKKCPFTQEEERKILYLHTKYGNSWSRIAAKLPGRSDNEIKNFWYKATRNRAKKQDLSLITPTKQDEQSSTDSPNNETDSSNESFRGQSSTPTNHHSSSSLTQLDPNHACYRPDTSSISSPNTLISTPHSQFVLSPANNLSTHLIQTSPSPHTPTSQPQNFPFSPHQPSPRMTPQLLAPSPRQSPRTTPPRVPIPSPHQTSNSSAPFLVQRKPPILSTPRERFKRLLSVNDQTPPPHLQSFSASSMCSSENAASRQMPNYPNSPMESPRSPLKLKLSPHVPVFYSVQNTPRADTTPVSTWNQNPETLAASLSTFQLKSPNGAPLSPLKLCLSIPLSSDSRIQSDISNSDSIVQLNASHSIRNSSTVSSLASPQLEPSSCSLVSFPIQTTPFDTNNIIPLDSSSTVKTESHSFQLQAMTDAESDLYIRDALREAEEKVRFLKTKLRQNRMSSQGTLPSERSILQTGDSASRDLIGHAQLERNSSQTNTNSSSINEKLLTDSLRVNAQCRISKTEDASMRISRSEEDQTEVLVAKHEETGNGSYTQDEIRETEELAQGENSGRQTRMMDESLPEAKGQPAIDSFDHLDLIEILNSNMDSWDDIPCQVPTEKCSNEGSVILQNDFLIGDLLGQTSGTEVLLASQGQSHHTNAFGPIYSQSTTTTTLVKSSDEGRGFRHQLGQGFFDGLPRQDELINVNQGRTQQSDVPYMVSEPVMEYGGEPYSVQISEGGNLDGTFSFHGSNLSSHQYTTDTGFSVFESGCLGREECSVQTLGGGFYQVQDPSREQRLIPEFMGDHFGLENPRSSEEHKLLVERHHSAGLCTTSQSPESVNPNPSGESGWGNKCGVVQNQMDTTNDESSSMLEFFPTTVQTPEWYSNGNFDSGVKGSNESDMDINHHTSFTSPPPISIADYI